jgi:hypothetical protein
MPRKPAGPPPYVDAADLEHFYQCPMCAAEGIGPKRGDAFQWPKAKGYAKGYRRSNNCKAHESQRVAARQKQRLADAPKDSTVWEKKRQDTKSWRDAHRERHLAQSRAAAKRWRDKHPEQARASVAAWAEKNRAKRKESQDAWAARKRLRGVQPIRGKRREDGGESNVE